MERKMVFITNNKCEICKKKFETIWIEVNYPTVITSWVCDKCYEKIMRKNRV